MLPFIVQSIMLPTPTEARESGPKNGDEVDLKFGHGRGVLNVRGFGANVESDHLIIFALWQVGEDDNVAGWMDAQSNHFIPADLNRDGTLDETRYPAYRVGQGDILRFSGLGNDSTIVAYEVNSGGNVVRSHAFTFHSPLLNN